MVQTINLRKDLKHIKLISHLYVIAFIATSVKVSQGPLRLDIDVWCGEYNARESDDQPDERDHVV